jgi:VCBS repeat-containing protein
VAAAGVLSNDTDAESDSLTASLVTGTGPTHGTLASFNSNGSFNYTPNAGYVGSDTFQYKANDGILSSSTAATVTINVTNTGPTANNDSYSVIHDRVLSVVVASGVAANDSDPDGDSFTSTVVANPTHGTLTLNSNGSFTYTPTAHYVGSDSFTYKDTDSLGAAGNTATVTLSVINVSPVANNDSYSTLHDHSLTIVAAGVLANDTDADSDSLTSVLFSGVSHGTLNLNSNGSFLYVPAAGYSGTDSFVYKANDGAADSGNATVTISVSDHAPVAINDN